MAAAAASGAMVAACFGIGALALRDARASAPGRALAALVASLGALELATGPAGTVLPDGVRLAFRLLGAPNVALLWLFCLRLLRDDARWTPPAALGFALFCVGPTATAFEWTAAPAADALAFMIAGAPLLAIAHVVWVALAERGGDLVADRRSARLWLPLALAAFALVSVLSEQASHPEAATLIRTLGAGLPGCALVGAWLLRLNPDRMGFAELSTKGRAARAVDPRDQALLDALRARMDEGAYREPRLTIETLAEDLKTPVHRLRALINQGLGHRNVAAFLNGHRLRHVKAALSDPARGRETVLAIAYEAGFAALPTFNRVFKEAEGETPTRFRERALEEATTYRNRTMPIDS
jgi:AraC-like DNA-binding protein